MSHDRDTLFIGGEWVAPTGTDVIEVISPHTEEVVARVPEGSVGRHRRARSPPPAAPSTTGRGRGCRPQERIDVVAALRRALRREDGRHGRGDHGRDGLADLVLATWPSRPAPWMMLNTFLGIARELPVGGGARRACSAPTSSCAASRSASSPAIVPWNVPQFVTMSKLAPALLAGCTIVVKPAPETPLDALPDGRAARRGRRPEGRRSTSCPPAARSASTSSRHPGVDKVAFTGSTAAGRTHRRDLRRAAQAGAASSSAASRPRSSSTTPTSRPRWRA